MKTQRVLGVFVILAGLQAAAASTIKYGVDKNHSTIGFNAPIMGFGKVTGKFTDFDITIVYDEKDIAKSSVNVVIKAASVNTGVTDRDTHLRTADFFDAEKHPDITFTSTRIEPGKSDTFVAHGTFRMRGVEKQMALNCQLKVFPGTEGRPPSLGILTKAKLNRQEFGIKWKHNAMENFVADEIEIDLAILTRRGVREENK